MANFTAAKLGLEAMSHCQSPPMEFEEIKK
jgi:hypothetical protein